MRARTGAWMDKLTISTNKGRDFSAGGNGGDEYNLEIPKGCRVVAFSGAMRDYMRNIKAYYIKAEEKKEDNVKDREEVHVDNE